MAIDLIVILGPTASGKTRAAVQLASQIDGEIISADSRQVYQGMDIGTGKDLNEYTLNGKHVPYHLIDVVSAGEKFNVSEFQKHFANAHADITERGKKAILCGGTGLYLSSVLSDYQQIHVPVNVELRADLEKHSKEDLVTLYKQRNYDGQPDFSSKKRVIRAIEIGEALKSGYNIKESDSNFSYKVFGLGIPREERRARISKRLEQRFQEGMIDEVNTLISNGVKVETLKYYGLEYKFITEYLEGEYSFDVMFSRLEVAIHQFAKRQMTYFRKMEKDGVMINWVDYQKANTLFELL